MYVLNTLNICEEINKLYETRDFSKLQTVHQHDVEWIKKFFDECDTEKEAKIAAAERVWLSSYWPLPADRHLAAKQEIKTFFEVFSH